MAEYYGVQRSEDYLNHYGIKGMKWGVRKARYYGNDKALERHYRKAAKHLAKLEDIGNNPEKYAAKAAAYGAAAAGTGTFVIPRALQRKGPRVPVHNQLGFVQIKRKIVPTPLEYAGVAATLGLGAAAGVNAYRAANAKKYRKKAAEFRSAIKDTFKGTKYEGMNGLPLPPKKKVRRKSK